MKTHQEIRDAIRLRGREVPQADSAVLAILHALNDRILALHVEILQNAARPIDYESNTESE